MWYFTFAANNRLLRKNTTFSLSMFSNNLKIFLYGNQFSKSCYFSAIFFKILKET